MSVFSPPFVSSSFRSCWLQAPSSRAGHRAAQQPLGPGRSAGAAGGASALAAAAGPAAAWSVGQLAVDQKDAPKLAAVKWRGKNRW